MPPFSGYPTRLPIVNGDDGSWGHILENFLAVSFNYSAIPGGANGTLNTSVTANHATGGQPGFVQLGGDLAGAGSSATAPRLSTVITAGSVGSSTQIPVLTYDAKGRITAVTTASLPVGSSSFSVDGGNATSTYTGTLQIDFGGAA